MTSTDVLILQMHSTPASLQGVRGPLPCVSFLSWLFEWDRVPIAGMTLAILALQDCRQHYVQAPQILLLLILDLCRNHCNSRYKLCSGFLHLLYDLQRNFSWSLDNLTGPSSFSQMVISKGCLYIFVIFQLLIGFSFHLIRETRTPQQFFSQ